MDKHLLHNVIHKDSGNNSEKCPVCNGEIDMSDKKALMGKAEEAMKRNQGMGMMYKETKPNRDDIDKARLHSATELLEFADNADLPEKIQILRAGTYNTQKYGKVVITKSDLEEMVKNFKDGVRAGGVLPIDTDHDKGEANGWIKDLSVDTKGILWGEVLWTSAGEEKLKNKSYGFISAEFDQEYIDPEHSIELNNVLIAASLVNRPMLKELQPLVKFNEDEEDKKLTDDKKDVMIFVDLDTNQVTKNHMDIKTILAKAKAERTSDEAKFLSDHQEELTPEQKTAEGFSTPEVTPDKKGEEEKKTIVASEDNKDHKRITASEWDEFQAIKKKMEFSEITETVNEYVFNSEGGSLPKAAVTPITEFMQKLAPSLRVEFEEKVLKNLPTKKIFGEIGEETAPSPESATIQVIAKVESLKKDGKAKTFGEGLEQVRATDPALYREYKKERGQIE